MEQVKKILEQELKQNIIPFWNDLVDEENGGFYGAVDMAHEVIKEAPKGIVYISRILYSYSGLYLKYREEKYLALAKVAYDFMINKMHDDEYGGFYWSCTYDGKPLNNHKHLYGMSFALYGLANYYLACHEDEVLKYANEMYEIIKRNLIDFPNRYHEEYSRQYEVLPNEIMMGYDMIPDITTNTLLHLAESISLYYHAGKNEDAKWYVKQILDILFEKCYDYEHDNLYSFLDRDFNNIVNVYSYGHNLEVSWLFVEIMKLSEIVDRKYFATCISMFETNFKKAYKNGYVINQKVNNVIDYSAIWWIQAETLCALNNINNYYPKKSYINAMRKITDFIVKHFVNEGREWYWGINEDFSVQTDHSICEMWKANYHNVRAILRILEDTDGKY